MARQKPPRTTPNIPGVASSGEARADHGGVANTGVIIGAVTSERHVHHHYRPESPPEWPVLVGQPPALASAFQARLELREQIRTAPRDDDNVLLIQDAGRPASLGTRILAGGGGVGKSQLAAWFVVQAIETRTKDLVVWINATSTDQVVAVYARTAMKAGVPGANGLDPFVDARALLEWLSTTDRTWLIVLDDITDPAHLVDWWPPHRPTCWTLATSRLQDATLASSGRQQIDVDIYSPDESVTYLTDRLARARRKHLLDNQALDLAIAVGHLPLALSHAAAYLINQEETCAAYLTRYTAADGRLADLMPAHADPDAYGRPVALTLLLALEAADATNPAGLARPALALAALMNPAGHPETLWATAAVTGYLTSNRHARTERKPFWRRLGKNSQNLTANQAREALRLLHRYGLITHASSDGPTAVRIHALTARAAREAVSDPTEVAHAAAEAMLEIWPTADHVLTDETEALHANVSALYANTNGALWRTAVHPLLKMAGTSLLRAGLHTAAITFWDTLAADSRRVLGKENLVSLLARHNLASAYWHAGRTGEAIALAEQVLANTVQIHGRRHDATRTARQNLATSYWQAGRTAEAIALLEQVVADEMEVFGEPHPETLTARANLAAGYWQAGRIEDAIDLQRQVVAERMEFLGELHPETLIDRSNLATFYAEAGRIKKAIALQEQVVDDSTEVFGERHPETLTARGNLASFWRREGRTRDAIRLAEQVLADRIEILGKQHPLTIASINALREWRPVDV
jgi:tetratricopeptide (TPR) repeat protein